ncbi:hypothetical protein KI387_022712, partial [Taxus chinensis]
MNCWGLFPWPCRTRRSREVSPLLTFVALESIFSLLKRTPFTTIDSFFSFSSSTSRAEQIWEPTIWSAQVLKSNFKPEKTYLIVKVSRDYKQILDDRDNLPHLVEAVPVVAAMLPPIHGSALPPDVANRNYPDSINEKCPKCIELKLPRANAAFCSQDCFKVAWSSHKSVHTEAKQPALRADSPEEQISAALNRGWLYCLKKGQKRSSRLPFYDWTGPLKPYPISPMRLVPENISKPDWAIDGIPKEEPTSDLQNTVEIKTPEKIEKMRETCR